MQQTKQAPNGENEQREQIQNNTGPPTLDKTIARAMEQYKNDQSRFVRYNNTNVSLWIISAVVLVAGAALVWQFWSGDPPAGTVDMKALEIDGGEDSSVPPEPQPRLSTTKDLREDLAVLTARVDVLTDSITRLEDKLARVHMVGNSIIAAADSGTISTEPEIEEPKIQTSDSTDEEPEVAGRHHVAAAAATVQIQATQTADKPTTVESAPGASENTDTATVASKDMQEPAAVPITDVRITESQNVSSATQGSPENTDRGPWVINVASLQDKAAAESYATKIRSKGIPIELNVATRMGVKFWRIQVVDFATVEAARSNATLIKEKLGLTEVWITRR